MLNLENRQISTLTVGILAALKIILQAFGLNIITDTEINQIADGVAALVTVIAVFMTHVKKPAPLESGSSGQEHSTTSAEITQSIASLSSTSSSGSMPQAASDGEARPPSSNADNSSAKS